MCVLQKRVIIGDRKRVVFGLYNGSMMPNLSLNTIDTQVSGFLTCCCTPTLGRIVYYTILYKYYKTLEESRRATSRS